MLLAAVLASAVLHAAWNALLRSHPEKRGGSVAVLAICAVVATAVAIVHAAATGAAPFPGGDGLAPTLLAGLFEGGYFACLTRALGAGALGPVYTISRGGAVLAVWPISMLALGEPVGALAIAGSVVLLAGLATAGMERHVSRAAVGWALGTAACIAGYHLVYKVALDQGAAPAAVFAVAIAVAVPVQAIAMRVGTAGVLAAVRAAPRRTIAAGVLSTASFVLFLFALRAGGAGAVLTLRNTSVVFALIGARLVGDHASRRQVIGAVLVAAGAALVGLQ